MATKETEYCFGKITFGEFATVQDRQEASLAKERTKEASTKN